MKMDLLIMITHMITNVLPLSVGYDSSSSCKLEFKLFDKESLKHSESVSKFACLIEVNMELHVHIHCIKPICGHSQE